MVRRTKKHIGWSKEKPGYKQRSEMLKRCGRKCFLGPEKSWEYRVIKWRYALPSILMRYTVRSRDNLPHAEEEINSDGEYESYTDAD